jgi:hypothetical protein
MGNNSVQEGIRVDRGVRSLSNAERPQEKCETNVQWVVCEVQTGTHTFNDKWTSVIGIKKSCRYDLPSTKAVCDELDIVLKATFWINPALGIKRFRIWEDNGIARNSPGNMHLISNVYWEVTPYQWHP